VLCLIFFVILLLLHLQNLLNITASYMKGILVTLIILINITAVGQCLWVPLTLNSRIDKATYVVKANVLNNPIAYKDDNGNIYTLKEVSITAWLKGYQHLDKVYIIERGGFLGNEYHNVIPSTKLVPDNEYILLLETPNVNIKNKALKTTNQYAICTNVQGAIPLQDGAYTDIATKKIYTEPELFNTIKLRAPQEPMKPDGSIYKPIHQPINKDVASTVRAISTISPNPAIAGTIDEVDRITITGTGFGNTAGSVLFPNADDAGATTVSTIPSDIISWTNTRIVTKIPTLAGTGPIKIGSFTSSTILTIDYSHYSVESATAGFPGNTNTRQRYYLRDINGSGGYSFQFSTVGGFASDAAAQRAFERALTTWRCATGLNVNVNYTPTNAGDANDNISSISYDANIPDGELGRISVRYGNYQLNNSCNQFNGVWYLSEVDLINAVIPKTGFTWNKDKDNVASATEYDMETVFLHDIGHTGGISHVIDQNSLMHYLQLSGQTIRTPGAKDIAGVNRKIDYSVTPTCFNPTNSGVPMTRVANNVCILDFLWTSHNSIPQSGNNITLQWKANKSLQEVALTLEKSIDGVNFETLLNNINTQTNEININNVMLSTGITYFRLAYTNQLGQKAYSPIIKVMGSSINKPVIIVQGNTVNISSNVNDVISIYDISGKLIQNKNITLGIPEKLRLPTGAYIIRFTIQQHIQKCIVQ
jgi:hypothetical protein